MASIRPHLLVVGMGNLPLPRTRHSLGHYVLDSLVSRCGVTLKDDSKLNGLVTQAEVSLNNKPSTLTFFKPNPLMNVVGQPVARALRATVQNPSHLVVLHDTLHLQPGQVKTKFGGSPSGHRGVRSVIRFLNGDQDFYRLLLGIGRSGQVVEYVLGPLSSFEKSFWSAEGEGTDLVWDAIENIARKVEAKGSEEKSAE